MEVMRMKFRIACSITFVLWMVTTAHSQDVWMPKPPPPGTPEKPENVRIVKFGALWNRIHDGGEIGYALTRYKQYKDPATGKYAIRFRDQSKQVFHDFDVDGDGKTEDDSVLCHPFDLSEDNPLTPVGSHYDITMGTQRIYGGMTSYHADDLKPGWTEEGVNEAESGGGMQPVRNWAFHCEAYKRLSPFRIYGLFLWQKFDFNNGGDQYRVSFNENSELRHQPNRYYMGIEGFRWVVRNQQQFYISEYVYHGTGVHVYNPVKSRWAKYNPTAPYKIDFEPTTAKFEEVVFDDVTAVGYLVFKHTLAPGYFGYKWYAFEGEGVVHRPAQPSQNIAMTEVKSGSTPFYMTTCEVPYLLWRKVHRLARYNTFAGPRGFSFRAYGDMGSMAFPEAKGTYRSHGQNEPVTNISYADALAWCNALSQQESKLPCYYVDPEFKTPYRDVVRCPSYLEKFRKTPVVYVNWAADGYRLPTQEEWLAAWKAGDFKAASIPKSPGTVAVGKLPGKSDLYDLAGNVWEMVWNHGNSLDLAAYKSYTVMGGDFRFPDKPEASSASAYGDKPFSGNPCIGFRMVRREPGLPAPKAEPTTTGDAPAWTITRDLITAADPSRQFKTPLSQYLEIVPIAALHLGAGKYEVTYAKWKPVYDWAMANGYEFDTTGEMGSMAYWGWGPDWKPGEHGPDEPVTGITHYDAAVWLNALSHLEGRQPVIYADKGLTKVITKAYIYRPPQVIFGEDGKSAGKSSDNSFVVGRNPTRYNEITGVTPAKEPLYGEGAFDGNFPFFYEDKSANGYRLPTGAEFCKLLGGIKAPTRNLPANIGEQAWLLDESGLRTHPVGQKKPNELGLYDIIGNVNELGDCSDKHPNRGEKIFAYVRRMGGGFFDPTHRLLDNVAFGEDVTRSNGRALPYPDTGFRPIQQNGK